MLSVTSNKEQGGIAEHLEPKQNTLPKHRKNPKSSTLLGKPTGGFYFWLPPLVETSCKVSLQSLLFSRAHSILSINGGVRMTVDVTIKVPKLFMEVLEDQNYFGWGSQSKFFDVALRHAMDCELNELLIEKLHKVKQKYPALTEAVVIHPSEKVS